MKKRSSKLFEKFEDSRILKETAFKINGGNQSLTIADGPTQSQATGDTECTMGGQDCGDNVGSTDVFKDSVITQVGQDGC